MRTQLSSDQRATPLVPPRRLGGLLSSARAEMGLTLEEVAERSGGRFSLAGLAAVERGVSPLDDADLRLLAGLYGLDATSVVPRRSTLVIDLEEGRLSVADRRSGLDGAVTPNQVLVRYLALVYAMRGESDGRTIPLRVEDLAVLGTALSIDPEAVATNLAALMSNGDGDVRRRSRLLSRRVLVPAAGVLVACLAAGAVVLVKGKGAPDDGGSGPGVSPAPIEIAPARPAPPAAVEAVAEPEIGTAAVQFRGDTESQVREIDTQIAVPMVMERSDRQ